jgi:hypothetical protein
LGRGLLSPGSVYTAAGNACGFRWEEQDLRWIVVKGR